MQAGRPWPAGLPRGEAHKSPNGSKMKKERINEKDRRPDFSTERAHCHGRKPRVPRGPAQRGTARSSQDDERRSPTGSCSPRGQGLHRQNIHKLGDLALPQHLRSELGYAAAPGLGFRVPPAAAARTSSPGGIEGRRAGRHPVPACVPEAATAIECWFVTRHRVPACVLKAAADIACRFVSRHRVPACVLMSATAIECRFASRHRVQACVPTATAVIECRLVSRHRGGLCAVAASVIECRFVSRFRVPACVSNTTLRCHDPTPRRKSSNSTARPGLAPAEQQRAW